MSADSVSILAPISTEQKGWKVDCQCCVHNLFGRCFCARACKVLSCESCMKSGSGQDF